MTLPQVFLDRPLAHRGLHGQGRPENTRAACVAAIEAGYGIELDLQLSRDGVAMVFHDETLDRLTDTTGPVADRTAAALGQIRIAGTDQTIPTLADVLDLVGGAAPLLIELKDQDGALGDAGGTLEAATARTLESYNGDVALMSFNPNSVVRLAVLAPHIPRGLTTCDFCKADWPTVPADRRATLAQMPDYTRAGAVFVSHQHTDLDSPHVARIKARGAPVLTWTIRSKTEEIAARKVADNITFEGYAA